MIETVRYTQRNVKRWRDGDMRRRWTAAGMLVAEQQFRRIIGYRDLAKLVIAIERHAILAAPTNLDHQDVAEPVTVRPSTPGIAAEVPQRPGHPRGPDRRAPSATGQAVRGPTESDFGDRRS
jgi:hypothetical protein